MNTTNNTDENLSRNDEVCGRSDTTYVHAHRGQTEPQSPVSPPLVLSTTFRRDDHGLPGHFFYSRVANPNRESFEHAMCSLEHGAMAFAFASGLAASMAVFQTLAAGDHVVFPDDVYYGVRLQLTNLAVLHGVSCTAVDMSDIAAVRRACLPSTRLLWIETPSNPLLKICDISAIVSCAHQIGARVVCDNTWATPVLQHPLLLGCDAVVHSATKFIGGHSDVLLGCVVVRDDSSFAQHLHRIHTIGGAVASAHDCWMASRGLQTLPVRIRAASSSAARIADFLHAHVHVERVLFPGLRSHPGCELALSQMLLPGAMLSVVLKGSDLYAQSVAAQLCLFAHATSLGGVESLVEHRASVEPADSGTPGSLLRFSIGLEDCDELIADLDSALKATPH